MVLWSRLAALTAVARASWVGAVPEKRNEDIDHAKILLHESMAWMDMYYDNERAYLFDLDAAALVHDTRSSVWYAAGLLARNEADDSEQAGRIVENVIRAQFKNESEQWLVILHG